MKKFQHRLLKPFVVLFAFAFTQQAFASDLYWVNGSGNWTDPSHWSTSSGGSPSGIIPGQQDNIIIDNSSFLNESYPAIYLSSNVNVNAVTITSNNMVSVVGADNTMKVQGSFQVSHGFYIHIKALLFASGSPLSHTIDFHGNDLNTNITFESGKWELQSPLKTALSYDIRFLSGELKSNGNTLFAQNILANDQPYTLDLSSSVVFATHSIDFSQTINSGSAASFYTQDKELEQADRGGFGDSGSSFHRDQSFLCSNGMLQIDVTTVDYLGSPLPYQTSCNDSCDGQVTIVASGTPGPYSYSFNAGPFTTSTVYNNLCAGNYLITVIDSSNELVPGSGVFYQCTTSEPLNEPPALQLQMLLSTPTSCPGVCDGSAFTQPVGGAGLANGYTVTWTPSGEITTNPTALCQGQNTATLVDGNGCMVDTTFNINSPPNITATLNITPPTCNGDCDAEVSVNAAGGNGGPYTFSWDVIPTSGQGTNPGIGFCAGPIVLSIFDVSGCQQDTAFTIIDPPVLSISSALVANASCFGSCDGQASSTPAGGVPGYTFEWFTCPKPGVTTGITAQNPSTLCAGDYYVVVTDNNGAGCTAESACITITEPTEIDAIAQAYQISCFGVCDGAVDVDATGGTIPYTFSWVTVPGGVGVGGSDSLSGMCAGIYEVTVTDFNGCNSAPDTVEIIEPPQLTLNITGTDPSCYDLCDGSAVAVAGGGTAPYGYVWSPAPGAGQGTPNPSGMCALLYTLDITDANGCTLQDQIQLNSPPQYDISSSQTNLQCNGDANGTISVTVNSGGSGVGYTYNWAPAPAVGQGTPNVSGLTAGVWCVTISDDVLCDTTICFTITEPTVLNATASVISQVTCFAACNGSAQVVIAGGTPVYNISWVPGGQSSGVASNLCAGNYTVTVTDANGCTDVDNVLITEPAAFDIDSSHTDILCFGACTGTATVNVNSGGTGPYTFLWNDAPLFQNTPTAINLCAGNYTVTITDQNLCDTVIPFTIIEPPVLLLDTNVINSACFANCSGAANITVAGGVAPYTFEWFNALTGLPLGNNNDSISNLCPGDYYAQVTDANGCTMLSDTMTITELPQITTQVISTSPATCGMCDGGAEVLASGGTGTFTYTWNPAPGGGQGTSIASGLCGGPYNVVATDQAGCSANIAVNISSVALEVTSMDSTDITCFGLCDGTATITYNAIDPPYTVEWFDNLTGLPIGIIDGPPASQPSTATGLCAGEYLAVLTNGSGCVTSDTIVVNEPPQITGSISTTPVTCNGACDGTATIAAAGGTGALNYTWNPLPGGGQGTTTAIGLCAGNWDVTVTDAQGCSVNFPTTITQPTALVINNASSTDVTCFGANNGTAFVLHSGGTGPFTYEWFDCNSGLPIGQTTQVASILSPGDYQVVITDANGCAVTSACLPVNEPSLISGTLNVSPVNCYGDCDGMVDVVAAGGTPTYFYQWQTEFFVNIPGQTNDTMNNVCQGIYHVVVTDINGCSQTFGPIDMTSPINPWDVTTSQINATCSGSCDGAATVTVLAGNNPPYTYQWDDAPIFQTTSTATNLCAGFYSVTISDAGICDTTVSFTILDATPLMTNASITNVLCFGDCTGSITLNPSGGTGPYTVTWSDMQVGNTASGLCSGGITATITDALGCTKDTTINISEPTEITASSSFSNNSACGACNGSATVNVAGGVPGYTFLWSPAPGVGQGTNNASAMCPGVYSLDVTDQNGCVYTEVFAISDIPSETLTMDSTDVSCFGACDGGAEVIYICSDPVCNNQWYDGLTGLPIVGETGTTISNLCAGDYFVEVINGSGCVSIAQTTVNSPSQIIANEVITQITCNGAGDGTITLAASGGSGAGYSYFWTPVPSNGQGNNQALNLTAGTWCVDITDGSGCVESYCYDLIEPNPITITPNLTNPACNGSCNGIITIAVAGGYGSYTYQWYDGGGVPIAGATNPLLANLCAGNYTIEVTDAGGCVATLLITLTEPSGVTSPIVGTDVLCFGDCTGTATVTPSGGFGPYIVNWYNTNTGLLIGQSGNTAIDLCPDDYHAVITDNNGCNFTTASVPIGEPTELTWTITSNDASCFGVCDGDANILALGGTPGYTYEWLDISGNPIVGGTNSAVVNLCAGNYTVEVTDVNGCSSGPEPVIINENPEITGNIFTNDASCGVADGTATIFPNGGTAPFTFQWLDNLLVPIAGETNSALLNAFAGTYYVEVTDAAGCTEIFQADISNISTTTLTWDAVTNPTCNGGNDGSLSITVGGVSPPFTYTWNPGGIIAEDPTGLTAGNWTVQVTDAAGCINFYDTTLVDPAAILVSSSSTAADCGVCNGTIDVVVSGGSGGFNILWNNGLSGPNIIDLCAGMYEAQITDANGCLVVEQVDVPNSIGLTGDQLITAITCVGACDGAVTVTGIGGSAPYTYLWLHDNSVSPALSNLCAGSYFVEITDATGCTYSLEVVMSDPAGIQATANITNPACGNTDGSITVTSSGGVLPHTYLWSPGAAVTPAIGNLAAGVYTVTITDASGCSQDFVYGLNNSSAAVANLLPDDPNCASVCDGQIDVGSISGGTPAYNFQWLDGAGLPIAGETNQLITGLCEGDYTLEITDNAGCISFYSASLTEPDTILFNPLVMSDPTCFGLCDGQLIANPIGGSLPFVFSWNDPNNTNTPNADSLCDGSYTLTITDANGCVANQSGAITEPTQVIITLDSLTDATCWNSFDGEIYITISGGTPGYTTLWVSETLADSSTVEDAIGVGPMNYYVTATDANGCIAMDTIFVDTLISVLAFVGPDTTLCLGDSVSLYGYSNIDPNASLIWYDTTFANVYSVTNNMVPPTDSAGAFQYIFTATYVGCTYADTINITVANSFTVDAGPDIEMFTQQTEVIGGNPTSTDLTNTFIWSPPLFLDDTTSSNPNVVKPTSSNWYYVLATDTNGCTAIDSMYVKLKPDIVIPDGISPDGNGLNDTWILDFIELYPGVSISINVYNRWGEPLFTANETYQDDWGGTTKKGKRLPAGTYYYTIVIDHPDFPDPFTGPITIMW